MSRNAVIKQSHVSEASVQPEVANFRNATIEERRRLVSQALSVGNPGNNAQNLPSVCDPCRECQIELSVDDIHLYEHNPRRTDNVRFPEIKASVRTGGIRNPLTVTRRPGEQHFIVESGGNTRLRAMKELWLETNDVRFRKLVVIFRPWRSETHVLVAHLVENELRGELRFWDKANGIAALKARLEVEKGGELSIRDLVEEMSTIGLAMNTATLAQCLYATQRLRTLGEAIPDLSGLDVKSIQPRLNRLKRFAQKRSGMSEDELYETVFEPVFKSVADQRRQPGKFSALDLCRDCENALVHMLGQAIEVLQSTLQGGRVTSAQEGGDVPGKSGRDDDLSRRATIERGVGVLADADHPTPGTRDLSPRHDAERLEWVGREAMASLGRQVRDLATRMGIGDWVLSQPTAPRGFAIQTPAANAASEVSPSQQRGLQLLRIVAGQAVERQTSDETLVRWLIDPRDEAAAGFLDVVRLVRSATAGSVADAGRDRQSVVSGGD